MSDSNRSQAHKSIPIVTGSDDNYAIGVAGLIASLGRTNTEINLSVLSLGISKENQSKLLALGQEYGLDIAIIDVDRSLVARLQVKREHITSATFLRLLIPSLFPNAGNLLYLDCDMTVVGDLRELYDIDLGSNLIAAVEEPASFDATTGPMRGEINAGLLLMNIPNWIRHQTAEACLDLLANPDSTLTFEDQSAINQICVGKIHFLPQIWNTHASHGLKQDIFYTAPQMIKVLHFVGDIKPWNAKTLFSKLWWSAFDGTELSVPIAGAVPIRRRLSRFNLKRREFMAKLLKKPMGRIQQKFETNAKAHFLPQISQRLRRKEHGLPPKP